MDSCERGVGEVIRVSVIHRSYMNDVYVVTLVNVPRDRPSVPRSFHILLQGVFENLIPRRSATVHILQPSNLILSVAVVPIVFIGPGE